jgi:hypothetical protein
MRDSDQPERVDRIDRPADQEPTSFMHKVLKELAEEQHNHRHCVMLMHGFIELLINALIEAKCRNAAKIVSNNRDYPHSVKLLLLHELRVISDSQYKMYDWFRKLRNRAAHAALFEITNEDLQRFRQTSFEHPDQFAVLCVDIFIDLWNSHIPLFAPKFSPAVMIPKVTSVPDYLQYSRNLFVNHHTIAHVRLQTGETAMVKYRYDHYPDLERIIAADGATYVRAKWEAWKESADWGETAKRVTFQSELKN